MNIMYYDNINVPEFKLISKDCYDAVKETLIEYLSGLVDENGIVKVNNLGWDVRVKFIDGLSNYYLYWSDTNIYNCKYCHYDEIEIGKWCAK